MVAGLAAPKFNTDFKNIKNDIGQKLAVTSNTRSYSTSPSNTTNRSGAIFGSQRTFGTAHGITAQRSKTGFEPINTSSMVREMNMSTPPLFANNMFSNVQMSGNIHGSCNKASLTDVMAGLNMLASTALQISKEVNNAKSTNGTQKSEFNYGDVSDGFASKLSKSDSFSDIKGLETKVDTTAKNFNKDYDKTAEDNIQGLNGILNGSAKTGLEITGVNIDTSKLKLSDLKLDPEKLSSYDDAARTIGEDIKKVDEFLNTDVKSGIDKLSNKSSELTTSIQSLQAQINLAKSQNQDVTELEKQLNDLQTQKKAVDDAKKELEGKFTQGINELKTELQGKQNELGDIKKFKEEIADKKYDLAKDQSKTVTDNSKKMDKLGKEITSLQEKLSDKQSYDKNFAKLQSAIKEFNGYLSDATKAQESLKVSGQTNFVNSKNKILDISDALGTELPQPIAEMKEND